VAELLLDTDVFVDLLRGARRLDISGHRVSYSVITRAELFAGRGSDEQRVGRVLSPFREIGIDRAIAERAGRLRRAGGIEMPDALIAATALEHGLELATRNVRDFANIPALRVRDPSTLAR
jgi:predicted nucleic acid-binding protein